MPTCEQRKGLFEPARKKSLSIVSVIDCISFVWSSASVSSGPTLTVTVIVTVHNVCPLGEIIILCVPKHVSAKIKTRRGRSLTT